MTPTCQNVKTFFRILANVAPADQHMIEPGSDGVTALANVDESRTTEYYGNIDVSHK